MSRKVNYVSKATDGVYNLTIKGNNMIVTDVDGNTGSKTFMDGEQFDIGKGFWNCFKQIKNARKNLKLHDQVQVIDLNQVYDDYWQWFDDINLVKMFIPGLKPETKTVYMVAAVGPHKTLKGKTVVAIYNGFDQVYLIDQEGLQKV